MQQEHQEILEKQLTEEELHAIYIYLAMHYEDMEEGEKQYWNYIMEKIDPEYGNKE